METTIPIFPCKSLNETLDFYRVLGFEVTYRQDEPYWYGAVCRGEVTLHFSKLTTWSARNAVCLVLVPDVVPYHQAFADGLRTTYGKIPTAGFPRITRHRKGQTRFHIFDPSGNVLIYVNEDEQDVEYGNYDAQLSPLAQVLENAVFLRDTYANDHAAATVLDKALARHNSADRIDRARALALRAELAVAMGDVEVAQSIRDQLAQITLSNEDRTRFQHELDAAEALDRWLTQKN